MAYIAIGLIGLFLIILKAHENFQAKKLEAFLEEEFRKYFPEDEK